MVFIFTKAIKNHSVLRCGVMFRLCSKSHFWCMFLAAESAAGHLASSPWVKKCLCSLDQSNNAEFLKGTGATSFKRRVDISRWATENRGRKEGGVKSCGMKGLQCARYLCGCCAVFYCGGCIYCLCDENMGIRGRCDVLISIAYATNAG